MKEDVAGLFEAPKPELFFSDIPVDTEKEYTILVFKINNYTTKRVSGGKSIGEYLIFESKLLKGFDDFPYDLSLVYLVHLPLASFKIAWQRTNGFKDIKDKEHDCMFTFKRETKKKIVITKRKFLECNKYKDMGDIEEE